ncbi:MAG: hypothetical protein QOE96_4056 [Blastocatellia bacterium]|jgi:hypothetical protein|nr:hypothetical protein [Blastocatellia bacterium]
MTQLDALRVKYDNRDIEARGLLLKCQIPVSRKKHLELRFRFHQQGAIRQTTPAHLLY